MLIKSGKGVKLKIAARAVKAGKLYTERKFSLKELAEELGVSRATAYKDLTVVLMEVDPNLYKKAREILDANIKGRYEKSAERLTLESARRRTLAAAEYYLNDENATYETTAEFMGVSPRTIRRDFDVTTRKPFIRVATYTPP
jgi:DeoR/GlpR family transcriptional regulator of sugar metabolism